LLQKRNKEGRWQVWSDDPTVDIELESDSCLLKVKNLNGAHSGLSTPTSAGIPNVIPSVSVPEKIDLSVERHL